MMMQAGIDTIMIVVTLGFWMRLIAKGKYLISMSFLFFLIIVVNIKEIISATTIAELIKKMFIPLFIRVTSSTVSCPTLQFVSQMITPAINDENDNARAMSSTLIHLVSWLICLIRSAALLSMRFIILIGV